MPGLVNSARGKSNSQNYCRNYAHEKGKVKTMKKRVSKKTKALKTVLFSLFALVSIFVLLKLDLGIFTEFYDPKKEQKGHEENIEHYEKNGSLDNKADDQKSQESKEKEQGEEQGQVKRTLTINAVGDIMMGRRIASNIEKQGGNYMTVLEEVAPVLSNADIVFANVEAPFTDRTKGLVGIKEGGKYVLKNPLKSFEAFKMCGFNLVSLANNHILDYYKEGVLDTYKLFEENGIAHSGTGENLDKAREPAIMQKNGIKAGLLSYTDMAEVVYKGNPPLSFVAGQNKFGVAPKKRDYIIEDIKKTKPLVDLLIISLHWGIEESFDIADYQIKLAHEIIDSGADIIFGHHPHQFQGIEIYDGKPIFYSLGNFVFDQNDPENQESFIATLKYEETELKDLKLLPIRTINKNKVVLVKGDEAEQLLKRQQLLCERLQTKSFCMDNFLTVNIGAGKQE